MSERKMPERVVVASHASQPFVSAAARAAELLELALEESAAPVAGALNIGPPEFAAKEPAAGEIIASAPDGEAWQAFCEGPSRGWVVTGATPFAAMNAALTLADWLRWGEPLPSPFRVVRRPVFRKMGLEFDDWSGGFHRMADGFDMEKHVADAARVGMTTLEINLIAEDVPIQVIERRVPDDKYQWWCTYAPALDMFFESDLTRNIRPRRVIDSNLAKLKATAELARKWGMTPTFIAFEPRNWPERLYDLYPEVRGARVDSPEYSAEPEYALDVNHPLVLEHYAQLMTQLMETAPDLGLFSVWSQDSAAGFPWADRLYPGPNGPTRSRRRPIEETVVRFMANLRDAGRSVNPDLQLTLCISWFSEREFPLILDAMPKDIGFSLTVSPDGSLPRTGRRGTWSHVDSIRQTGREPDVQVEEISNPWKPLGPLFGFPFPWTCFDMLKDIAVEGRVESLVLRGGITSEAFVPNFINNEVLRAFQYEGASLDVEALALRRARAWANEEDEAEALVEAWRLCDRVFRHFQFASWTVNFVSGRTLWRRLVKPLAPNQTLLSHLETRYYVRHEWTVGRSAPAYVDHFYKGWSRALRDDRAAEAVRDYDESVLPKVREALAALEGRDALSDTSRDVRDRIRGLLHMFTTDRNLIEVQEAIHACLGEDRERPESSAHVPRLRAAIRGEIENVRAFIELLETTPSTLFPVTSGEETPYIFRAPLSHLLRMKVRVMEDHVNDAPGPWFDELSQPGGWTSDLR